MRQITNYDDVIDSRDAMERIEELSAEDVELSEDESAELSALQRLASEAEGYAADWRYGETLIRDSYFETYAQEMAEDMYGQEMADARWPFNCIDWERAAQELQMDYTAVDFDGVTYWVR